MAKANPKRAKAFAERIRKYTDGVTFVYTLVMIVIFVLFFTSNGYSDITADKYNFFIFSSCGLVLGIIAVYLGMMLDGWRPESEQLRIYKRMSISKWFALAFILAACISALLSPYKGAVSYTNGSSAILFGSSRYEGLVTLVLYVLIYWLIGSYGKFSKWFLIAAGGVTCAFTAICLLQWFNLNPFGLYPLSMSYKTLKGTFIGTIGNINMVSGLLCVLLPICAVGYITMQSRWRWLLFAGAALGFFAELMANADSGYVGLLVAALLMIPFLIESNGRFTKTLLLGAALALVFGLFNSISIEYPDVYSLGTASFALTSLSKLAFIGAAVLGLAALAAFLLRGKAGRIKPAAVRLVAAALVLIIIIAGFVFVYNYDDEDGVTLLYQAGQMLNGHVEDEYGSGRGFIWRNALTLGLENPIFGTGPDSFTFAFNENERIAAEVAASSRPNLLYDAAHNEYLQIFCNLGLVGLITYLGLIISLIVRAVKYSAKSALAVVLLAAVVCYCVQAFFSFSISIHTPLFWLTLGLLERELRLAKAGAPEAYDMAL